MESEVLPNCHGYGIHKNLCFYLHKNILEDPSHKNIEKSSFHLFFFAILYLCTNRKSFS
jgi:hypothetical protein